MQAGAQGIVTPFAGLSPCLAMDKMKSPFWVCFSSILTHKASSTVRKTCHFLFLKLLFTLYSKNASCRKHVWIGSLRGKKEMKLTKSWFPVTRPSSKKEKNVFFLTEIHESLKQLFPPSLPRTSYFSISPWNVVSSPLPCKPLDDYFFRCDMGSQPIFTDTRFTLQLATTSCRPAIPWRSWQGPTPLKPGP